MDQPSTDGDNRCLTCGYLLRGLPEPVCPECGRAFDPADESTFDTRPPGWRRRRRIKRGAAALAIAVLLFAFAPRGILRGRMTFTCRYCGEQTSVSRWELRAPRLVWFRYPGFCSMKESVLPIAVPSAPCAAHVYGVAVRFDMHNGGWASGTSKPEPDEVTLCNWGLATPTTATLVLENLMAPGNNGISIGTMARERLRPQTAAVLDVDGL